MYKIINTTKGTMLEGELPTLESAEKVKRELERIFKELGIEAKYQIYKKVLG